MSDHEPGFLAVVRNVEEIHAAVDSTSNYTKINLYQCHLDSKATASVVKILRKNECHLKVLCLTMCSGYLEIILTVALSYTFLESVGVFMGSDQDSKAFDPVAHSLGVGLQTNSCLRNLTLGVTPDFLPHYGRYFTLSSGAARSLQQGMRGNSALSMLHIENCRFGDNNALRILATGLPFAESLRDVAFGCFYEPNGQQLEDQNVAVLIHALTQSSQLECLDLSYNKCLDSGMEALASLLDMTPIRCLNLSSQQMDQNEFMNVYHLVGALGRNSTVESLNLQSNNLSSDYDMASLAAILVHNTSIKHINLADNYIGNSAMNILSSKIPSMKVLEVLQIDKNDGFDDETSKNLARAMRENTVIRILECDESLVDRSMIRYYADLNWGGRGFLTHNGSNGEDHRENMASVLLSLWPKILARVQELPEERNEFWDDCERQANIIYFFLRRGSAMFPL